MDGYVNIERCFSRLVSMEEFALRTFPSHPEYNKKYISHVRGLMKLLGIEEVYDKKGKKQREKREQYFNNIIEGLTKNLSENSKIQVPDEFKNLKPLSYV